MINLKVLKLHFSRKIEVAIITALIVFSGFAAQAQFFESLVCPQVTINLSHPPDLGIKVSKIAFGPATGICSDELIAAIQNDFISNNLEVIDRVHLNSILGEHQLTLSGYVDQASAAAIGKILGPSALVFVKVQICNVRISKTVGKRSITNKEKKTVEIPIYFSHTKANLRGSIQAVDLATGRIFGSQPFEYSPEKTNESELGYPQPPAELDVQHMAFNSLVNMAHRMFLPWSEPTTLYYYDNKDHNLKSAYQALQSGKLDLAFDLSAKNLEECKGDTRIKEKLLSHAYYNMGMSFMLREEYDKAIEFFQQAAKLHPGDIVSGAIKNCNKAKELLVSRQRIEQNATFEAEKKIAEQNQAVQADQANTLTNKDIIKLTQMKLSNAVILQKIKSSKCNFDTSPDALGVLNSSGVSDEIIVAMMSK